MESPCNILAAAAGDGLWFPILIDDERQRIKQWEMAREGRDERGAKGAGGRSDGGRIDGIFFTEGYRRGSRPYPFLEEAFTTLPSTALLFLGTKLKFQGGEWLFNNITVKSLHSQPEKCLTCHSIDCYQKANLEG